MDLDRPEGFVSTYCFTLARVCEDSRKWAIKNKMGKPSACNRQETAFCVEATDATTISRGLLCSRNEQRCQEQRKRLLARKPPEFDHVTECEAMRNTDTYESAAPASSPTRR